MWTLEHDGNLFGGKKVWLKPGTQQIFGRTRPPGGKQNNGDGTSTVFIDDKRVSRKHITITVSAVEAGHGMQLHSRSKVEVTETSKFGTSIDGGPKVKGETIILTKTAHTIQLGSWGELLRIKWEPVVLTLAIPKKHENALTSRTEPLDIKTSIEYAFNATTHVVTLKRNTPKCLQALINAKHIVTSSFVDGVVAAATAQNADPDNYVPSLFELDFEGNWPKEVDFIPPVGQEPVPRPAQMFEPDPNRADVFVGYTFIFCDERQYDSLSAPVNSGGGKALLFPLRHGETTVEEFVEYARNASGNKRIGEFGPGKDGKGVVVVRYSSPENDSWVTQFVDGVDLALNQRSMLQNEFLDAIITNKASELRRPLPEGDVVPSSMLNPPASAPNANTTTASTPASNIASNPPQPPKTVVSRRRTRRPAATNRFDDFDEFVPLKSQPKDNDTSEVPETSQALDSQAFNTQTGATQPQTLGRKRRSPPSDSDIQDSNNIDALFPAAAAMKKRRIQAARTRDSTSKSPEPETAGNTNTKKSKGTATEVYEGLKKAKKKASEKEKDLNLVELARARREAEEEVARKDAEALRNAMDGVDISELRGLATVEEMELPARAERSNPRDAAIDPRWDPRWNGRKNFKGFRRNRPEEGQTGARRAAQKVLVPLEEVSRRSRAPIGDDYFLESTSRSEQTRDSQRSGRSGRSEGRPRLGRVDEDPDAAPAPILKRRQALIAKRAAEQAEAEAEANQGAQMDDVVEDSMGAGRDSPAESVQKEQPIQRGKRLAAAAVGHPPPVKKVRGELANGEDTGFRFRRRKL